MDETIKNYNKYLKSKEFEIRNRKIEKLLRAFSPRPYTLDRSYLAANLEWNEFQVNMLVECGDLVEIPRRVEHYPGFQTEQNRDSFIKHARTLGFSLDRRASTKSYSGFGFIAQISREDAVDIESIDAITLKLSELVARFRGRYFGWEPTYFHPGYEYMMLELCMRFDND